MLGFQLAIDSSGGRMRASVYAMILIWQWNAYLCVRNDADPEVLGGTRHAQGPPEEDHEWQGQRQDTGGFDLVHEDHDVRHEL